MTEMEIQTALDELDRLLNDLDTPMDPDRVWALLAKVSPCLRDAGHSVPGLTMMPRGAGNAPAEGPVSR